MQWIIEHYHDVLEVFGAVVAAVSVFMKLFATDKTKGIWANILKVLATLSLVNPDGSIVGRKEDK